ncbi:MAG TPA: hypothetical protein VI077_01725 [Pseudolabrys sp.]|jgi:hypothetical protein
MELLIIALVIAGIVWIVWKVMAGVRSSRRAELDDAWRVVLSDPDYVSRRQHEERKLDESRARRRA